MAAGGGRIRLRGQDGDAAVIGLELRHVGAEIGGRVASPDGFVVGAVGDVDARADHVQLVLHAGVHRICGFESGLGGKFVKGIYWKSFGFVRKSAVSGH